VTEKTHIFFLLKGEVKNHTEAVADPEISKGTPPEMGPISKIIHFGLQFFSFTHMKNFWQKGEWYID
jgi:hypothetical protein